MKILAIGHSYVIDSNRKFWNQAAEVNNCEIDLVVPKTWKSNLVNTVKFEYNSVSDDNLNTLFPLSVYFSGNGSLYHFEWINLYKVLSSKKYDVIFLFQETWALSLAQLIFLKALTINSHTQIHLAVCQNIIKPKLAWIIPWERCLTSNVKRIWYCTSEILKVLKYKRISNSTGYLAFTFDQSIYQPKIKNAEEIIRLGYMGRLTEEKGLDTLIDSARMLKSKGYKVELHLAGSGPLLEKLTDDFIIKHGLLAHREAHHFYHKFDIFVLPSKTRLFWKEQFGRVLVESTASGTPVIGSSSGAIPEVIEKIGFGEVFKESDAQDLADKILQLHLKMKDQNYQEQMSLAISRTIEFASHKEVGKMLISQMMSDLTN